MHHFKALRTISIIFGFALVIFGCAINKKQVSEFPNIEITAVAVPEGILVSFSNLSNIPAEIDTLGLIFVEYIGNDEPDYKNNDPIAVLNTFRNRRVSHLFQKDNHPDILELVKQNGSITFPFVQPGHKYEITVYFANSNLPSPESIVKTIRTGCIAEGGIYFDKILTLKLNDAFTGVTLSGEPSFTTDVQFDPYRVYYAINLHKGDYTEAIGTTSDDLFWDFAQSFNEHLKEAGVKSGDYPAVLTAGINVIYNDISWLLEIAHTSIFTYSL